MLSESVSNALLLSGRAEVEETARFVGVFDKCFDILNVNNFSSAMKKQKPFQRPYTSAKDARLKVHSYYMLLVGV